MLKNMKIGNRLLFSYTLIIFITIAVSLVGIINFNNMKKKAEQNYESVTKPLSYLTNFSIPYGNLRSAMRDLYISTSEETNQAQKKALETNWALMEVQIAQYMELLESRKDKIDPKEYESLSKLNSALIDYKDALMNRLVPAGMLNENEKANSIRATELVAPGSIIRTEIDFLTKLNIETGAYFIEEIKSVQNATMLYSAILLLAAVIAVVLLALIISGSIVKPINHLIDASTSIANGNLNINVLRPTKDEIGTLSQNFKKVVEILQLLIHNMSEMAIEQSNGNIEARIDNSLFLGSYGEVAKGINDMVGSSINELNMFAECMSGFGEGNFKTDIPKMPGKKVMLNQITNTIRDNLESVHEDMSRLVRDAIEGKLSTRVDASVYKGDWLIIMNELNRLMGAISAPIREVAEVMQQVSAGNFKQKIKGDYKGDFLEIENSVNSTISNIASYIDEISQVLSAMSQNNLNQEIKREYVGSFSIIKDALNHISTTLSEVFYDIASSAEQVAAGAKLISESSITLSVGATEQTASIEELNENMLAINKTAKLNSLNSKEAEQLSVTSKDDALKGDQDMNSMLVAMNEMKSSSGSISKIIKVINDIAFQTNLLALNAAVEAARAGTHGVGFSVVAEEVRSLAGRSQSAAKETESLIEDSISRVSQGTLIANKTADTLQAIVGNASRVAGIITEISGTTDEQTAAITMITNSVSQVASVVQNNTAVSEEVASAAQQLSSQADMLRNSVSAFKLRKNGIN